MSQNKALIYVDGVSGNDSNSGDILSPVYTLQHAYDIAFSGATIVLQSNPTPYGSLNVNKNISILSAYGIRAKLNKVVVSNAQFSCYNIDFSGTPSDGLTIDNIVAPGYGSLHVIGCFFNGLDNPIVCNGCNYVSIHQCRFDTYLRAISVNDSLEFTASSNVFYNGAQAFYITNASYVDVYHNTGSGTTAVAPTGIPDVDLRILYVKMSSTILSRKYITLPSYAYANNYGYDVALNVVYGPTFDYGHDYTVINGGLTVSWQGLQLEEELQLNDVLRIMYSEGAAVSSGEAVWVDASMPNSRIDSNNITDALVGVHVIQDAKIRNNNFFNSITQYVGPSSDVSGNISSDPLYVDEPNDNYRLSSNSPDIDAADPLRWKTILQELGVGLTGGGFTGIFSVTRPGVAPFNRNLDGDGRHRNVRPDAHDIGAYEFGATGVNSETGTYINEDGFDIDVSGSMTGPYATLDRAFEDAKDISIRTNPLYYSGYTGAVDEGATGFRYGRYFSDNMILSDDDLIVGKQNKESISFIYPSYPSCGLTGVFVGPTPSAGEVSGITGSSTNPFRTITEAISYIGSTTGMVFVYPGLYPAFQGSAGIKLVGLPKTTEIPLGKTTYSNVEASGWTGSDLALEKNVFLFTGTSDITSKFEMIGKKYIRFNFVSVVDSLEAKILNPSNYVAVKKSGTTLTVRYNTGGNTYSVNDNIPGYDPSYRASISIIDDKAIVTVKGTYTGSPTNLVRNITLASSYTGPWLLNYTYTDNMLAGSTGAVSNLLVEADQILYGTSGICGITGTSIERKIYGILGEVGMSGLYSWYGKDL